MVSDFINIMKTTLDLNYYSYQVFKQHSQKHGNKENMSIKKAFLQFPVNLYLKK